MQNRKVIFKNICVVAGLTGIGLSMTPLAARLLSDESSQQHSNHTHLDTNRFTAIGNDWPPQPKNMENIVWLRSNISGRATPNRDEALATSISADDVSELGERFTYVSTRSIGEKGSSSSQKIMTFFSHSNNSTVEVEIDNGSVGEINQTSPSKYQPPLTTEEVKDAVKIARESFLQNGVSRIEELKGYGILAFKKRSEMTSTNGGFFDTRVAYISFHEHVDARPEFVAWVDLSEGTVIKSREDNL